MKARLHAPEGVPCEGGDSEHSLIIRTFVAYYRFRDTSDDDGAIVANWCDECAEHAEADGQFERVCPVIRIDEHGTGFWQGELGWWGAPLLTINDMPELSSEFFVEHAEGWSDEERETVISFLRDMESLA